MNETIMTYFKIIMHLPSTTRNKTDKNAIRMKALPVWAARAMLYTKNNIL